MTKRFLFINLAIDCGYRGVNHGVAYLVPVARAQGYEVSCIHLTEEESEEEFASSACVRLGRTTADRQVSRVAPDIVAFSATSHQIKFLERYSRAIKDLDILQIAGGTACTLDPEGVLEHSAVAGVCVGEGEAPLAELLGTLQGGGDARETKGFVWREEGNQEPRTRGHPSSSFH